MDCMATSGSSEHQNMLWLVSQWSRDQDTGLWLATSEPEPEGREEVNDEMEITQHVDDMLSIFGRPETLKNFDIWTQQTKNRFIKNHSSVI